MAMVLLTCGCTLTRKTINPDLAFPRESYKSDGQPEDVAATDESPEPDEAVTPDSPEAPEESEDLGELKDSGDTNTT